MKSPQGFTVVEVLVALAIIGIAFGALALSQVNSLRASARSQYVSEAKAAANRKLETVMAKVLKVTEIDDATASDYKDDWDEDKGVWRSFYFIDYMYSCPDLKDPPGGTDPIRGGTSANLREPSEGIVCSGLTTENGIETEWAIRRESGLLGEGVLTVTVTGTHLPTGASVTLGNRVTCYDVFPSPSATVPDPCPTPAMSGSL